MHNCYQENIFAKYWIGCFIKTDKMKCLRSINFKFAGSRPSACYWGYLFCFEVSGETNYSINESIITLDIEPWNLILN